MKTRQDVIDMAEKSGIKLLIINEDLVDNYLEVEATAPYGVRFADTSGHIIWVSNQFPPTDMRITWAILYHRLSKGFIPCTTRGCCSNDF